MKRLLASLTILSVFLFFTPFHANAAGIAFDAWTSGGAASTATLTFSHTTTGSNRFLVVSARSETGGDHISGITYAGTAMTRAIAKAWVPNNNNWVYLYYLLNPASGANDVVVSGNGTNQISAGASSYTGATQSVAPDTGFVSETASGDRYVTVNVTTANSWLVENYVSADANPTAIVGGVTRGVVGANPTLADSNAAVGSGNQTIGMTWGESDRHIILGLAFAPAADAGGSFQLWLLSLF